MIADWYFYAANLTAVVSLCIVVGALLFARLNARTVAATLGVFALLFLAQRWMGMGCWPRVGHSRTFQGFLGVAGGR